MCKSSKKKNTYIHINDGDNQQQPFPTNCS